MAIPCNTWGTVDGLYAWYHGLVKQVSNDEAVMKTKATEITKNITGDSARIGAVYNWVQDNIRYIAYEDGIAGLNRKPRKMYCNINMVIVKAWPILPAS